MITSERRDASTARVPTVEQGQAIIVTRYEEEKAVIVNPVDFHRLEALDTALEQLALGDRPEMSELALKAHRLEDDPGEPIEDPEAIKALLSA